MALSGNTTSPRAREQSSESTVVHPEALREMLGTLIRDTLEREFAQFLGAQPHERSATRRGRGRRCSRGCERRSRIVQRSSSWLLVLGFRLPR